MQQQQTTVGFMGLGHMGTPMARRILAAGYPLVIFERAAERAQAFARDGARAAASPQELAAQSDVIILMLTNDDAVRDVLFAQGALAAMRQGALLVDMSTVAPATSRAVAQAAQARGIAALDAPVAGSVQPAQEGKLIIYVGGDDEAFQRVQPILQTMGQPIYHMGPSGAGNAMKLVINSLLGLEMQAIAEALALGEGAGLPRDRLLDALSAASVLPASHRAKLDNARHDTYPDAFSVPLMGKDLALALDLAATHGVAMPATAIAQQMNHAAHAALKPGEDPAAIDYSLVIRLMARLAGLDRS